MKRFNFILSISLFFYFIFFHQSCSQSQKEETAGSQREYITISFPSQNCNILSKYDGVPEEVKNECFFPFPFTQFFFSGKVSVPAELVKIPEGYPQLDLSFVNSFDGFSPANQIIFWHPKGFSREGLPKPPETLNSGSLVQVIEWDTGERIPVLVEPDARANPPYQILYIRPLKRMKPSSRYIVVMKKGIKSSDGKDLNQPAFFKAFVEGKKITFANSNQDPEFWLKHFSDIVSFLEKNGIKKEDIFVAWDFPTASDEKIIAEHMKKVRDTIYENSNRITFVVDKVETYPYDDREKYKDLPDSYRKLIMKSVEGRFHIPKYDNPSQLFEAKFLMNIPECAKKKKDQGEKIKVMIFGHGLFGSVRELDANHLLYVADYMCVIIIATEWIGIDFNAVQAISQFAISKQKNMIDTVFYIVSNLKQGHSNFLALALLAKKQEFWNEVKNKVGELPEIGDIVYYGISNGAIQGGTFMALTNDVKRGVLDVGGSIWTSMLERNVSWDRLKALFGYQEGNWELELKKIIGLAQIIFDIVDPITFAPYIVRGSEKFGIVPKQILYRMALYDEQVANFSSETYVRTAGIPGINRPVKDTFGIEFKDAPFEGSGFLQVDAKVNKIPPPENIPPPSDMVSKIVKKWWPLEDSGEFMAPHEVPRRIREIIEMQKRFYEEGKIYQLCSDNICDPN